MRDTISKLFSDKIILMAKREIAALKPDNIDVAAEELAIFYER